MKLHQELPFETLQPSQLYVSAGKLEAMERLILAAGPDALPPVPVKELDGRLVLTDGHTRVVALFRGGHGPPRLEWEEEELDWNAYRICVGWCETEGIRSIGDLAPLVVSTREYEKLWLDRCRRLHEELG